MEERRFCTPKVVGSNPISSTNTVPWSSGTDIRLSRGRRGFDSLWDRHNIPKDAGVAQG